jgi:hypothetical protein
VWKKRERRKKKEEGRGREEATASLKGRQTRERTATEEAVSIRL